MSNSYVAKNYTNDIIVRIIATQVVLITILSLIVQLEWLFLFLAFDFFLRAFTQLTSPLALIGKSIISTFQLKPTPVFAAPKKFAASLGFGMSLVIYLLFLFHFEIAGCAIAGILLICATLEATFKICLGCSIHSIFVAPLLNARLNK